MLFNSIEFGIFLVIVYAIYWLIGVKKRVLQNFLLLTASYVFYGLWDWRFLGLLIASSLLDFFIGILLSKSKTQNQKRWLLATSVFWNIGVLIAFKYFNFFVEEFKFLIRSTTEFSIWEVAVPVGLSFYTFQTLSYSIDIYRGRIKPTKNILNFLCFVCFFPQLVAGPIERASKLLPQFINNRKFNIVNSKDGLRQILWGLFKKILVADKLAIIVDTIFLYPSDYGTIMLMFGGVVFLFQIYCDFSGYTDIAIGTAKLFGFNLSKNFSIPYISTSITEFWQRWHITLNNWFIDYFYFPLIKAIRRKTILTKSIGIFITMTLIGFWHGAKLTFIFFGVLNALILIFERLVKFKNGENLQKRLYKTPIIFTLIYFFLFTTFTSIAFRANTIEDIALIYKRILLLTPDDTINTIIGLESLSFFFIFLVSEVLTKKLKHPLENLELQFSKPVRWVIYYGLIYFIFVYHEISEPFIYFQF